MSSKKNKWLYNKKYIVKKKKKNKNKNKKVKNKKR
jgi:hypothetical protein